MNRDAFTSYLTELRLESGLTVRAVAESISRPPATVGGWFSGRHLPYARDDEDFARLLKVLGVEDVAPIIGTLRRLRARSELVRDNPFLGLESFGPGDADIFFGREAATAAIVESIYAHLAAGVTATPLLLTGASGSGKTSLLRAGVEPALREASVEVIYVDCASSDAEIARWRRAWGSRRQVVVLDQFEQLLVQGRAGQLVATISEIEAGRTAAGLAWVLVLRADWFAAAAAQPTLAAWMSEGVEVVLPPTRGEVQRCIVGPAEQCGLHLEPGLLDRLVSDFASADPQQSAALPLLSHVLRLVADRRKSQLLTERAYDEVGGIRGAIQRAAEEAVETIKPDDDVLQSLLLQLVVLGPDGAPCRRSVRVSDLDAPRREVIEEFVDRRLLVADRETVSIAHEALLSAWPRLARLVESKRHALQTAWQVAAARRLWEQADGDNEALLSGRLLEEASGLSSSGAGSDVFGELDRRFVTASQEEASRRELAALRQTSAETALTSELLRSRDPIRAAELALSAHLTAPTVESRSALMGLGTASVGQCFPGPPGPCVVVSSAKDQLAFMRVGEDVVTLLELQGGGIAAAGQLDVGDGGSALTSMAYSPSGDRLAVVGSGVGIAVFSADGGGRVASFDPQRVGVVSGVAFDSEDSVVLIDAGSGRVQRWLLGPDRVEPDWEDTASSAPVAIAAGKMLTALVLEDGCVIAYLEGAGGRTVTFQSADASPPMCIAVDDETSVVAVGYQSGDVRVWSIAAHGDPDTVEIERAGFATWVNDVDFAPGGTHLAAASSDGTVRVWDLSTGKQSSRALEHPAVVTSVAFVGTDAVATTSEDGALRTLPLSRLADETLWCVEHSEAGDVLVATDRSIRFVGRSRSETHDDPHYCGAASIRSDGELVAAGSRTGHVTLRSAKDLSQPLAILRTADDLIERVHFDPQGKLLASAARDGQVSLWAVVDGEDPTELGRIAVAPPALQVAFTTDSMLLAACSEFGGVTVVGIGAGTPLKALSTFTATGSSAMSVAWQPRTRILAVGGADRTVSLWDLADPADPSLSCRLTGPLGNIVDVSFSPAGDMVGAASTDGRVWLWRTDNLPSTELHATISTGHRGVYCLSFHPNGQSLTTGGTQGSLEHWTLNEAVLIDMLASRASHGLATPDQQTDLYGLHTEA